MPSQARVAIGICTAYRPAMLGRCLMALAAQAIPPGCGITAIVVDNEPEPNNRQIVEDFAATCRFPIRYLHEPRRGISTARNAVLDACADRFDWIAFTDDDCEPALDWIASLLAAAERHGADVVYGRREWIPPQPVPFWLSPMATSHEDGEELGYAATHNVLMAGGLAGPRFKERPAGLRFDERLAHGEDTDFFYRAILHGARIVYSTAPVVYETIPLHRATLRYQMMRAFYYSACQADFLRRYHKVDATLVRRVLTRLVWQVPLAVFRLIAAPLIWPFSAPRYKRTVIKYASRIVHAAGMTAGLAGFIGDPYRDLGRSRFSGSRPHRLQKI
jgi:succinoglycan biosynthesis protein ExoM